MTDKIRLTQFAKGAGCGCKISPAVLDDILKNSRTNILSDQLLVGNNSNDDAAVYDLHNGTALLVTADFFMPIVDDAFTFGKVAAANALSDVYAMGGKPITAIALLGWPIDKLPAEIAAEVMKGAKEICEDAGVVISGGHTIDAPEPFFGLSVNGLVDIQHLKRNDGAKIGDVIMITKPLGLGILATAQKRNAITQDDEKTLIDLLTQLNKAGAFFGTQSSVHAMTDVTGFGLLGHLTEMCKGAKLSVEINYNNIPKIEAALNYAKSGIVPDATYRNWNAYANNIDIAPTVDAMESFTLMPDPQTNGGLLIAVNPNEANKLIEEAAKQNIQLTTIGRFTDLKNKEIFLV